MSDGGLQPPPDSKARSGSVSSGGGGGGFFDKVKKTFTETTTAAGQELSYVNRKRKGFVHPPEIEEHVNIMRAFRDEIPNLRERVDSVQKHEKEMAESEEKGGAEFLKQSEVALLHPHMSRIYKVWADKLTQNAAYRFQYQAALDTVKEEWKQLETVDLTELQRRQDQTNRALSDAKFYAKKDPVKSSEFELKYKTFVVEWVQQIQVSRIKKEELLPQFVLRWAQAEVIYLRASLANAEKAEAAIRGMGPVVPSPMPDFQRIKSAVSSSQGYEIDSEHDPHRGGAPPPAYSAPAPQPAYSPPPQPYSVPQQPTYSPPPPRPMPTAPAANPQARGLYAFTAASPQELSFAPGDLLTILKQDGQWWLAEMAGRRGLIPSNYVQLL